MKKTNKKTHGKKEWQKTWRKILACGLSTAMACSSLTMLPSSTAYAALRDESKDMSGGAGFNYAKALQYSLYFYDANMCGDLSDCSVNWRGNCHMDDQKVTYNGKTVDVSGGFHDAGDHDKFGLPQGYSASILGVGFYEYKDAYVQTGQVEHFKKILDHFCDYFKRCTVVEGNEAVAFCYQVGDGASHNAWTSPENEKIDRPAYFADASTPATDQVSEAAAALAIHYMNFGDQENLDYAKKLFAMAQKNEKKEQSSQGGNFYGSTSWADDYCFAAAWLYKATGDASYKAEFNKYSSKANAYSWPSWDDVSAYALTYGNGEASAMSFNVDSVSNSCKTLENGYKWLCQWGSARYNANMQLEGLIYDKFNGGDSYTSWAESQMKFLLGNSSNKQSYEIGYNENSPKNPHHRAASGLNDFPTNDTLSQNHSLIGALVGGIETADGKYEDSVKNYYSNEVAIDYNAAFTGALAALYLKNANDGNQKIVKQGDADAPKEIKTYYSSNGSTETPTEPSKEESKPTEPSKEESKPTEPSKEESKPTVQPVEPSKEESKPTTETSKPAAEPSRSGGDSSNADVDDTCDDWLHTDGANIVDAQGNVVRLTGVNWFGFNCSERVFHGLWSGDIRTILSDCANRGINLIRVPISTQVLKEWKEGVTTKGGNFSNSPDYTFNPELVNEDGTAMNNLQVLDKTMVLCKEFGIKVMLDVHSPEADNSGHNYPLWYNDAKGISTQDWIDTWVWIVDRYKDDDTLIACDLENEPHGKRDDSTGFAKWDDSTDENNWRYAAQKCGEAILKVNPNILIMVEGVEQNPKEGHTYAEPAEKDVHSNYLNYEGAWWGGNLRMVKKYPVTFSNSDMNDQVVYSPHDYGPGVYNQAWFDKDFTEQTLLDDYWYDAWAYLVESNTAPLLMGEWGGFMDGGKNEQWLNLLAGYMNKKNISHTFWCLNPNSGDTGGLLGNDWKTWDEEKYNLMEKTLWKQDGKYVGLDHQKVLGKNGTNVTAVYNETIGGGGSKPSKPSNPSQPSEDESKVAVTGVKLSEDALDLTEGEEATLKATVSPSNATNQKVSFQSDKPEVAKVENNGKVTAIKEGTAIVTVTTEDGKKTATCKVTVKAKTQQPSQETPESPSDTPSEGSKPGDTSRPDDSDKPSDINKPSDSQSPSTPGKPSDPESPSDLVKPSHASKPSEIERPSDANVPSQAESPSDSEKPSNIQKPSDTNEPSHAGSASNPSDSVKPSNAAKPSEIERPSDTDAPSHAEGPSNAEKPSEPSDQGNNAQIRIALQTTLSIKEGSSKRLVPDLENASLSDVTWSITDPAIAEVDEYGIVTAKKVGETVVTASVSKNGQSAKARCMVNVTPLEGEEIAVTGISVNPTSLSLEIGDKATLLSTIRPTNATNKNITWKSDDPTVASVTQAGQVEARTAGITVLTVSTEDGNHQAKCTVLVKEAQTPSTPDQDVKVTGIHLSKDTLNLEKGNSFILSATVEPSGAKNVALQWQSDHPDIADVDSNGLVIAYKPGDAVIKVETADHSVSASCSVHVADHTTIEPNPISPLERITATSKLTLALNASKTIKASVQPEGASVKKWSYSSKNNCIRILSKKNNTVKIKAIAPGIATLTIKATDAVTGKTKSCQVKITIKPAKVTSAKVSNVKKTSVNFKWKAQKNVSGYMVYLYNPAKGKYQLYKKITKSSTSKLTVSKLKRKTKYRLKIRAYKTSSGKPVYGDYAKEVRFTTK